MPQPDEPREEALKSLDERLAAFEAERAPPSRVASQRAMGQGYRFLGEVVGGVLGGLGFGRLFDWLAHTAPFGLIGGLLIGVGVSTLVAIRGAGAWAKTESERAGSPPSAPDDEDD
ncbi:MAG TPA: F0F1 ATP synthase assembly protein [Phenylobacterium sp.]|uniref:F0F1 ATP synthase assembly protein n=1 Tax=Phenylobacterium sp. TaxID=1871053 RepID=UPI002BD812FF|nr:F0F1 ATP synthase assembly protein [Phenylobacterium sp.]HSV04445.1 F0F1 ATP synthase assembly protein [Phenylobacterium sp.]